MPADTDTAEVTVYVIVCPDRLTEPAPTPKFRLIAGVPARPAPDTTIVMVLMVPVVAVLNENAYVTLVAPTWLFDTVQLTLVNAAASALPPTAASPAVAVSTTTNAEHKRAKRLLTVRDLEDMTTSFHDVGARRGEARGPYVGSAATDLKGEITIFLVLHLWP